MVERLTQIPRLRSTDNHVEIYDPPISLDLGLQRGTMLQCFVIPCLRVLEDWEILSNI